MIQTFADKIQSPAIDIPGAFAGGLGLRAKMDEMRKTREADQALPALLDAYGRGDTGALARVAYYNPQLASGLAQARHWEAEAKKDEQKAHHERFQQEGQFFSDTIRALNSVPPEQRGDVYESILDMAERAGVAVPNELAGRWDERKHARIGAMARMYAQSAAPFQGTSMEAQIANLAYGQALSQGADPQEAKMMAVNAAASRSRSVMNEVGDVNYIRDAPIFPGVGALGGMAGPAAQSPVAGYEPPMPDGALSYAPAAAPPMAGALSRAPQDFSPELDAGPQDMFGAMPQPVELQGADDALPPPDNGAYAALPPIPSALLQKPFAQRAIAEETIKAPFIENRAQRDEGRKISEEKRALDREIDKERRGLKDYTHKQRINEVIKRPYDIEREERIRSGDIETYRTKKEIDVPFDETKAERDKRLELESYAEKKKIDLQSDKDKIAREEAQKRREATRATFSDSSELRREFITNSKDFTLRRDAISLIDSMFSRDAEKAVPMNDVSLIIAYNKLLDPGAVVREQDFATVQNAKAAITDARVFDFARSYIEGGKLTNKQRQEIKTVSKSIFDTAKAQHRQTEGTYRNLSKKYGFDPETVVVELGTAEDGGPRPGLERLSPAERQRLIELERLEAQGK